MPDGRMLNRRISEDGAVDLLSCDTCRLAFTWTIPYLDRDGRVTGDPHTLRNKVFARRKDIADEQMEAFIREWNDQDLAIWYTVKNDRWLQFPGFRKNQPYLRYDREAPSAIPKPDRGERVHKSSPGPTPDLLPTDAGGAPDVLRTCAGSTPPNEASNQGINKDSLVTSDKNYKPSPVDRPEHSLLGAFWDKIGTPRGRRS